MMGVLMAEPQRDRWGRYSLPDPDTGEARYWTRATTLAEATQDAFGLTEWKLRTTVLGMGKRPDLCALAEASDEEDKGQLTSIWKQAMSAAGADNRAHLGTALHKATQRLDQLGDDGGVFSDTRWQREIEVYKMAKQEWGILTHPSMCERITVVPEVEVAGTMDKIVKYEDKPTVLDLKTGNSVTLGGMKIAIQIALYSRGRVLWDEKNMKWVPMVKGLDQDRGLVLHLPVGEARATLYEIDLNVAWQLALQAYEIRAARKVKDYLRPIQEVGIAANDEGNSE